MGAIEEGEEVGEISMMALMGVGVAGADMLFLERMVGVQRLLMVGGAMVGSRWSFAKIEAALIAGWDLRKFWTSLSTYISSL